MKQLSRLDASFLALESPTQTGHVASLAIFDVPEDAEDPIFPALCRALAQRIARIPELRQRLVPVPLELDLPYWIEDRAFELDYHLRHASVPRPGRDAQLAELVARLHGRPLDRARPLWEMYAIEGLEHGRFALYTKLHRAACGGLGPIALLEALADGATPGGVATEPSPEARDPGALEMFARGALGASGKPRRAIVRFARLAASALRGGKLGATATAAGLLPFAHAAGLGMPAPHTPWNRAITAHRRWAGFSVSLADVGRLRRAFGASPNDVVLALTAHALRRELERRNALPEDPLIAMAPVRLEGAAGAETRGAHASMALTDLATDEPDPVLRLRRIQRARRSAERRHDGIPADLLRDLERIGARVVAGPALRALAPGLANRLRPAFSVRVSNGTGPCEPLALAGAKLSALFPLSIVTEGQGLDVSAIAYGDELHFGVTACRSLMPELDELGRGFAEGLEELCKRADARSARVVH